MVFPAAVVIPTWNRAHLIVKAVEAALAQSHPDRVIVVVDDGSTDGTRAALSPYRAHPDVVLVELAQNAGTAQAKNVGILLAAGRAVTFHDSDDLPHRDKVLRQALVMARGDVGADPCLNWALAGQTPGGTLRIGAVLHHHALILPDGRRVEITRELSLIDDMFPNLQMGSEVPGDWTHVNSGLFHPDLFARLGGFIDGIEEDREFRNRVILSGEIVWMIRDVLMTKIETPDSLSQSRATGYDSDRRRRDRQEVWSRIDHWLRTRQVQPVEIDLGDFGISRISNAGRVGLSDALATARSRETIRRAIARGVGNG
ncbi:glycosyltransferase family A protein [Paenirhodobacter populi]|uniref:Glycosyltransferase n=1 Tax=Paenirhodobacter populi TaxID=2306993 RepID=A0A451GCX1_9RHOB|nr:glycosyltransferase family 2 protein [Sinirhodobacter populi]RWR13310.1 glycosyltransferase [Sinirhodobacter populi]